MLLPAKFGKLLAPNPEGSQRSMSPKKARGQFDERFYLPAVNGLNQSLASRIVPVERAGAHSRALGDRVQRHVRVGGERRARYFQNTVSVGLSIGAQGRIQIGHEIY